MINFLKASLENVGNELGGKQEHFTIDERYDITDFDGFKAAVNNDSDILEGVREASEKPKDIGTENILVYRNRKHRESMERYFTLNDLITRLSTTKGLESMSDYDKLAIKRLGYGPKKSVALAAMKKDAKILFGKVFGYSNIFKK